MKYFIAYIGNSMDDRLYARVFMYGGNNPDMLTYMTDIIENHYISLNESMGEYIDSIYPFVPVLIED